MVPRFLKPAFALGAVLAFGGLALSYRDGVVLTGAVLEIAGLLLMVAIGIYCTQAQR